jgi:hypothetical protein
MKISKLDETMLPDQFCGQICLQKDLFSMEKTTEHLLMISEHIVFQLHFTVTIYIIILREVITIRMDSYVCFVAVDSYVFFCRRLL